MLAKFVGQMSVADFCARLGCSVEELLERPSTPRVEPRTSEPPTSEPAPMLKPREPNVSNFDEGLMAMPLKEARAEFERRYLLRMLEVCEGNRAEASRRSGMSRSSTYTILGRPRVGKPPSKGR